MNNFKNCNVFFTPSFWAQTSTGILILIAIFIIYNNYSEIKNLNSYNTLVLLLLFTMVIGIHGLSHLGLEAVYGFNPISN